MLELSKRITPELAAILEDAFFALEPESMERWAIYQARPADPFYLRGYFEDDQQSVAQWALLQELVPAIGPYETADESAGEDAAAITEAEGIIAVKEITEADWRETYKQYLKPWDSGRGLLWLPQWMQGTPEADALCAQPASENSQGQTWPLYIEAGMAFGTGTHETTQLCAQRLLDVYEAQGADAFTNLSIIDAGCGTGILAISAYALGARKLYAFDLDAEAGRCVAENILLNGLRPEILEYAQAGLDTGLAGRKANLVLANIQTHILVPHAAQLLGALDVANATEQLPATLVLSGILVSELQTALSAFEKGAKERFPGKSIALDARTLGEWADVRVDVC